MKLSYIHVASFKMISSKSDFIHIFNDFIHVYIALGQGQKTPWGETFDVNRKPLSLRPFVKSFGQISLNSDDFIHIFNVFPRVYSPRAGADNLCGQNPDVNRKALSLCPFVANFKKISSKSDFIHNFSCFIHVYSPGAGADNPLGSEFLCKHIPHVTLVICCKFLPLNDFLTVFPV